MMVDVRVRGIFERDIDLLILEELVASAEFLRWFLGKVGLGASGQLQAAARSVATSNGETDLELTVVDDGGVTRLLIENKVDAGLQPRQPERYAERAEAYLRSRECEKSLTVLIAPEEYARTIVGFGQTLTYESILQWFEGRGEDERTRFKCLMLREAIERGSVGWTLVPDQQATDFWQRYWELAMSIAPELGMPRPGVKPATSSFIRFRPLSLPPRIELIHKVPYGNVDLQFAGMALRAEHFSQEFSRELENGMRIEQASKSLVVRIAVPRIELKGPFDSSLESVRKGILAAKQLLSWHDRVQPQPDAI
jgi:hypothetical protein